MRAGVLAVFCIAFSVSADATEISITFRQGGTVAGRPYYGVVDLTKQRYPQYDSEWHRGHIRWQAYGPVPLGEAYQLRRLVTVFDIGALPRGAIESATVSYTIHYVQDIERADWCKVFSTAAPYLADGVELASGEIPPGKAGENRQISFDVTEYVRDAGAEAGFELRSAHNRYLVRAWTSGKWGPWARATDRPFGSPDFFPTLTVTVSVGAIPEAPRPRWVGVGERADFGGAPDAVCTLASGPPDSALGDGDISGGGFTPDRPGRYVVKVVSGGVTQYATVVAKPIRSSHPRLSMDRAVVERLGKAAAEGDEGWRKLRAAADALVAKPGAERGYAGFGYRQAIDRLSLAYLVTGDEKYARKAIEVMEVALADGLILVSSDSGYCIRAYGPAIAIGYDRLHSLLSDDMKQMCWRKLNYWLAWYAAEGYQRSGPAMGNYFSGYFSALYVTAFATYGDNPRAAVLVDEAERFFEDMIAANVTDGVLEGGDDPEGRYAGLYFETWFNYLLTRKLCGDGAVLAGFDWPRQVALACIHRTRSDEKTFYDYGAWRDREPSWVTPGPMVVLSSLLAGTREGEYAQYFAAKYGDVAFSTLFDPARKATFWKDQPLSYFSRGLGLATARGSWDKGAYWVSMQGGGAAFCDHQHRDFGHFEFYRGADALLIDTNTEDGGQGSQWHNCLLVNAPKEVSPYTPGQHGGEMHRVLSFDDTGKAVVMTSDLLPNYTNRRSQERFLKRYHRTHAYIRPNVLVVVDLFETANPDWPACERLHFGATPVIEGSKITAVNGESKLTARFFGDPVTIEKVTGEKLLVNSVDCRPQNTDGPKAIVMIFAASALDKQPPECSAKVENGKVSVRVNGRVALTLGADGRPAGR
jgi:hypothetical protein